MITALDSAVLDANSEELGVSVSELMENAGRALAEEVDALSPGRALFICGSGNNGGDGYTAARMCASPHDVCAFRPPKSALCRKAVEGLETVVYEDVDLSSYDVIVDCVLGTGQSGPLRPEYVRYIERVNSSGCRVVACDMPTGLGTGTCVKADVTITFHDINMAKEVFKEKLKTIYHTRISYPELKKKPEEEAKETAQAGSTSK